MAQGEEPRHLAGCRDCLADGDKGIGHPEELARLAGARMVTASETDSGRRWAEGRVKLVTGGEAINARFMHANSFEFTPNFKLVIVGNHAPAITNLDDALRRRFLI